MTENAGTGSGSAGGVMAIRLVLEIVEALAKSDNVGVTQLANALGTTKARVFRHLRTLVDQGYATQDPGSERYAAGPRLLALSRVVSINSEEVMQQLARPVMVRLRERFGHSVSLSIVNGETIEIVDTVRGNGLVGITMKAHVTTPLHSTGSGKVLLSEIVAKGGRLPDDIVRWNANTIVEPAALLAELARVREQGWAQAPEETLLGINGVAAPIRDHRGKLVGAISMISSIQFITREPDSALVDAVIAAGEEIGRALSL